MMNIRLTGEATELRWFFLSNHEPDPDALLNYDIFAVNVASGAVRQITHTPGVEMEPRISPDGSSIAYTATKRKITTIDSVAEDAHAWVIPMTGGPGKEVNAPLDRQTSAIAWSPDSKSILYTVGDHGSVLECTTFLRTDETSCPIGKARSLAHLLPHEMARSHSRSASPTCRPKSFGWKWDRGEPTAAHVAPSKLFELNFLRLGD